MALTLYLAMTGSEIAQTDPLPAHFAWMACHFSPLGPGLSDLPQTMPEGAMLILNDRLTCRGHSPDLIAGQLKEAVTQWRCESLLLDFQRPPEPESMSVVKSIVKALPCSVAVSDSYARDLDCPIFLAPGPLHIPLAEYLRPWQGREIWLEAALCQETLSLTEKGTSVTHHFPTDKLTGGFFDEHLCCHYRTEVKEKEVRFTLFDTWESLRQKLERAQSFGVARAVGLFQELGGKN
ncbi:MAG: hypothetical protein IJX69_06265 [Oscillospiraceae bacterium]|nr:hypothetical protein [Oscillospiraceae bacterium]